MLLFVSTLFIASAVQAQTWTPLTGSEITDALLDRVVRYENGALQRFHASGATLYSFGEPDWGEWRVEDDQYCSLWPPADEWDCYDVFADGSGGIDFRDSWGNTFPGRILPE